MDQGSYDFGQSIESRGNDLVDTVKQAASNMDLKQQVGDRPWLALGAAVMAGYVVGTLLGDSDDDDRDRRDRYDRYDRGVSHRYYDDQPSPGMIEAAKAGVAAAAAKVSDVTSTAAEKVSGAASTAAGKVSDAAQSAAGSASNFVSNQTSSDGFLGQFDEEINSLKQTAVKTLRDFLRSTIREYSPEFGAKIDELERTGRY